MGVLLQEMGKSSNFAVPKTNSTNLCGKIWLLATTLKNAKTAILDTTTIQIAY